MSNFAPSIQLSVAEKREGDITRRAMCRKKKLLGETFISKCEGKKRNKGKERCRQLPEQGQGQKIEQEDSGSHVSRQNRCFVKEQEEHKIRSQGSEKPDLVTY